MHRFDVGRIFLKIMFLFSILHNFSLLSQLAYIDTQSKCQCCIIKLTTLFKFRYSTELLLFIVTATIHKIVSGCPR